MGPAALTAFIPVPAEDFSADIVGDFPVMLRALSVGLQDVDTDPQVR
jgi:hypothetical protein